MTNNKIQAAIHSKGISDDFIHQEILNLKDVEQLNESSNIIDIGCGQGELVQLLQTKKPNTQCYGLDIVKHDNNLLENFIQYDLNNELVLENKFNLVIATEVIEHVENPRFFIKNLKNVLKSDGKIVLTTPNTESISSIISYIFRGYHTAFGPKDYPAHITAISEYDLRNICTEVGLKIEKIVYLKNGRIPKTKYKWHQFFPWLKGKRFSDNYIAIIN